jgi:hypothetical protein
MRYNQYGTHFDYAARREFHREFWQALAMLGKHAFGRLRRLLNAQRLQREVC